MRAPIAVVISDGFVSRHVTKHVRDLRWVKSAYGGDMDLSCRVLLPKSAFTDLGPNARLIVLDHDGTELWSGNIDNPGDSDGPAGELLEITAFGAGARLTYISEPFAPVLTDLTLWERTGNSSGRAEMGTDERGDGTPTLRARASEDKTITPTWMAEWSLRHSWYAAGLRLGRVSVQIDAGVTDGAGTNFGQRIKIGTSPTDTKRTAINPVSTSAETLKSSLSLGNLAEGSTFVSLDVHRQGGANYQGTEAMYFEFWSIKVRQQLQNADGSWSQDGFERDTVLASEVINHLVGSGMVPATRWNIATTEYLIDSLAWLDGINAADVLDELRLFEPGLFWTLYGDEFTANLWANLTPRYVVNNRLGGVILTGDEGRGTKVNRVTVKWQDTKGHDRTETIVDPTVKLDYPRDAEPIELPERAGSYANARRVGLKAIEFTNNEPLSGKAVIRQPIRDRITGEDVMPHQIQPGNLVLHQETGQIYRLTEMDYSDADGSALLSLGRPVRTTAQWMARRERQLRRQVRRKSLRQGR